MVCYTPFNEHSTCIMAIDFDRLGRTSRCDNVYTPVDEDVKAPVLVEQATLHYPEAARAEQLHGTVTLRVHISDSGTVETA